MHLPLTSTDANMMGVALFSPCSLFYMLLVCLCLVTRVTIFLKLCSLIFFAGVGGYSYLYEPLWWVGMTTSESYIIPFGH